MVRNYTFIVKFRNTGSKRESENSLFFCIILPFFVTTEEPVYWKDERTITKEKERVRKSNLRRMERETVEAKNSNVHKKRRHAISYLANANNIRYGAGPSSDNRGFIQ